MRLPRHHNGATGLPRHVLNGIDWSSFDEVSPRGWNVSRTERAVEGCSGLRGYLRFGLGSRVRKDERLWWHTDWHGRRVCVDRVDLLSQCAYERIAQSQDFVVELRGLGESVHRIHGGEHGGMTVWWGVLPSRTGRAESRNSSRPVI